MNAYDIIPIMFLWTIIGSLCAGKSIYSPVDTETPFIENSFIIGIEILFVVYCWPLYVIYRFMKS